ncbi:hypothetical protein [Streptomyces jumonjinensis]|uniref:Uncharacterized protein n=1 Tax=Streptomyces jumonjinensis TaxID=1945 RepID=A0A646KLD6_STRJU|nr:hypothetical protein [Streptomyces jumonjinensis]MQT02837.1 hypothetical protein [Streptomyces jumonjinensis]
MSVIGKTEGIDHGTLRGYRQHRYRKVDTTEECGCLKALRDENAKKTAARTTDSSPGRNARQQWNGGALRGTSRREANLPTGADCPTTHCGQDAAGHSPGPRGWVRVHVAGSAEPARDYCSGSCATYGIALAELRMAA